ncbi:apolipoprotein N-acyltransferase [Deinococcus sp. HMF7620]|uniref:Apolipoprotein N-acyltransferase n=2 Tax=Deinococcus arboris TaxID=2682977 RepID=A0A7C9HTX6_9DEIO|nr:apolipoprotein N-acyltransferase [Deinococcus arboris]MVN88929.1 apolipoprotein N-acyltransferase [Deinococcus arboris]
MRTWSVPLHRFWLSDLGWAALGGILGLVFLVSVWSWLSPLPLAVLFRGITRGTPADAFKLTWLFGAGFFTAHLLWLPSSLSSFLGPGALVLSALLIALLATMWGLTAALTRRLLGPATLWGLPLAWTVLDTLRAAGPLGFPWGSLGYAWTPTPLIQMADLGGVALVGLLVALSAAALASGHRGAQLAVASALLLAAAYGLTRPDASDGTFQALLVQGNIDPRRKAAGRQPDELAHYLALTRSRLRTAPADLVVWPETAAPEAPTEPWVRQALAPLPAPLLLGAPTWDRGLRNSVYAVQGGQIRGRQDKRQLVPFGETFPARAALDSLYRAVFSALGLPALTGTVPGEVAEPLAIGRLRAGVLICYESTFPAAARTLVAGGANVLVTVSNDAWFGPSVGAEQHFQMGRVRAIETRRWWIRAGNDGISAAVDPQGKVVARFPRGVAGAFAAPYGLATSQTLFVRWGNWVPVLAGLGLLVLWRRRRGQIRCSPQTTGRSAHPVA